jgi:tRNA nucleotidyltransferase/poly(A) polymerase
MSLASAVPAPLRELLLQQPRPIWLVGGAVRDRLLGHLSSDLDFVVEGEARALARSLAAALDGRYFDLDRERDAGRVVRPARLAGLTTLDFTRLRGSDIRADLAERDFTVNALAIELSAPEQLIDPGGGLQDLKDRRLRACSPTALRDDPVRCLRGVRLALELDLSVVADTKGQLQRAGPLLEQASAERVRDELLPMLRPAWAGRSMRLLDYLGLLWVICPELGELRGASAASGSGLDAWEHTLAVLDRAKELLSVLVGDLPGEVSGNLIVAEAALQLGRFRERLQQVMQAPLAGERRADQAFCLAALYHALERPTAGGGPDVAAELAVQRARQLRLSSIECRLVGQVIRSQRALKALPEGEPRLAIHRFFRVAGEAGVPAVLLDLASTLAAGLPQQAWKARLELARALLEARFERSAELLNPPPLIRGDELRAELGLEPGPAVGALLRGLAEEQVRGNVRTRAQALEFARRMASAPEGLRSD